MRNVPDAGALFLAALLVGCAALLMACGSSNAINSADRPSCDGPPASAPAPPPVDARHSTQQPELIGGLRGLVRALDYPASAQKAEIWARVTVRFIVSPRGCPHAVTTLETTIHSKQGTLLLLTHPSAYDSSSTPRGLPLDAQRFVRDQNMNTEIDAGEESIRFDQFPASVQDLLAEVQETVRDTRWRPGTINGEPVAVTMTLPVTFKQR